jgi:hypothetical protein
VIQVAVDGGRLLAGVGEDGHVEVEPGFRPEGQEEQDGALDSGTEVQNMKSTHPVLRGCWLTFSAVLRLVEINRRSPPGRAGHSTPGKMLGMGRWP